MATQPPSRLPPASGVSPAGPPSAPESFTRISPLALSLQFEISKQLADLAAQQAAAQARAAMTSGAPGISAVSSTVLDHDTLQKLNQTIGGLSSVLLQLKLLSQSGQLGGDTGGDYSIDVAELTAIGKGLSDFLQGVDALGPSMTEGESSLSALRDSLMTALQALPAEALAVILYSYEGGGSTSATQLMFRSSLEMLKQSDSPLAPLASKVLMAYPTMMQPLPVPTNGKWDPSYLNQLTAGLSSWFKSPSDDPNGFWGKMQSAGLLASLTPWLQVLGQNGGDPAKNQDTHCLRTIAEALSAVVEVGGDSSLFNQLYQFGVGIYSLGFFMAAEMASYYEQTLVEAGGDKQALKAQFDKLRAQYQAANNSDLWPGALSAIEEFTQEMSGPNPSLQPIQRGSDSFVAPLLAMMFGFTPHPMSKEQAIEFAMKFLPPDQAKAMVDNMETFLDEIDAEKKRKHDVNKETRG